MCCIQSHIVTTDSGVVFALQILPGSILSTQLTIQDDCIRMPTVELNGVMTGDSAADAVLQDDQGTLDNLELDSSGSSSIFVFTDPTNLAALQVRLVTLDLQILH